MGKTNLLDAIHYLSFCKSHVNTPDSQIINSDQDLCVVQGNYDYEGREEEIFCASAATPSISSFEVVYSAWNPTMKEVRSLISLTI